MRSIMFCDSVKYATLVYPPQAYAALGEIAGMDQKIYSKEEVMANPTAFGDVDFLFSTWGMPFMTEEEIRTVFPNLKCVFYGAGTVQYFARPFLNCGVKVFSAWAANAVPVAEFTLAQILLANAGYFHCSRIHSTADYQTYFKEREVFPGNYDVSVGIIGVGMIGKEVIKLLKPFNINVMAYSRSLTEEKAAALGVRRSTIEEIFQTCQVVSNHLANMPQTVGLLKKEHFESMLPNATFINTGRGAQVAESEMIEVLQKRPDLFAVLDVTEPEPPLEDSPLYTMPNCVLTPHIAGSLGNEMHRMAEYMQKECQRYIAGEPNLYEVTMEMLEGMA